MVTGSHRGANVVDFKIVLSKFEKGGARGEMVIVVGRRHEFKSWTRLIAFHIVLIPLGKV